MPLVDAKVLVDVLEDDPAWAEWSLGQLRAQAKIRRLASNPIIDAEMSLTCSTLGAARDVAVREYSADTGPADHVLRGDRGAPGVIEAKQSAVRGGITAREIQSERVD